MIRGSRLAAGLLALAPTLVAAAEVVPRILPPSRSGPARQLEQAAGSTVGFLLGGSNLDCATPTVLTHGTTLSDSTVAEANDQATYGCFSPTAQWNGGEKVYSFTTTQPSDIRVTLTAVSGGDVDLFLLGSCDADDCLAWGNDTLVYPDAPAGTYFVVVDGWMTDSADYDITAWSAREILLVDDDNSLAGDPDVSTSYRNVLDNLGRSYTWWPVDFLGPPTTGQLLEHRHVVWFTGADDSPGLILSGAEESALAGYLDGGGKLILVSQEYLRDVSAGVDGKLSEGSFAFDYLQAGAVVNDLSGQQTTMTGAAGDPIGDDGRNDTGVQTLTLSPTSPVTNESCGMDSLFAEPIYRAPGGAATALRYDNFLAADFFRLVFASFPIENITSAGDDSLETFLDRSLTWIDQFPDPAVARGAGLDDTIGNGSGLPDPGETIDLTFTVQNNDTNSHDAEAYLVIEDSCATATVGFVDLGSVGGSGAQASGAFRIDLDAGCPIGTRIAFAVNLWVDGNWYDTSGWGFFVGQAETLLVKDEQLFPNTTGIAPYEQALQSAGVSYALHDNARFASPVYQDGSLVPNLVMDSYAHVVWTTGQDFALTLTQDDETELRALLDDGGKLLLVSQDYFWDRFDGDDCNPSCALSPGDFAHDYLGVATVEQDVVSKTDSTVSGIVTEEFSRDLSITLRNDQSFSNEADQVSQISLANARPLFAYPGGTTAGLIYEGTSAVPSATYRVLSLFYPFENLEEAVWPATPALVMQRALYWLEFGDTTTNTLGGPNTYYYPVDPAQLDVGLEPAPSFASLLDWTTVTTNTDGASIPITYHLYSGFTPTTLLRDPTEYQISDTTDSRIPTPGQCIFYRVHAADPLQIESQQP